MALGFEEAALLEVIKYSLPKAGNKVKQLKEDFDHFRKHKFLPYLMKSYEALNVSTSQLFRNKGFRIDDLYVPLTIRSSKNYHETIINGYPEELFIKDNKIIINDNAGMGKSTILKMLYRYTIDEAKGVPFYIDMKSLINGDDVIAVQDFILKTFPKFSKVPTEDFWLRTLDSSKFLFLFDGADEVPDIMKSKVFDVIKEFCTKASHCNFVVATRNEDIILSSFYDFTSHQINPLKEEEAYLLLRKYQFKDVNAEELIQELEKAENTPVKEFLTNPLLTTLLYTAYAYKRKIPLKKNLFFSQIYNALYENHDATKIGHLTREKKSGLDIDEFEIILSHLAYRSRAQETLKYNRQELTELLTDISQKHPTITFNVRGFIDDMVSRVPVLRKDGFTYYWQHKSIQEYFFVRFLFTVLDDNQRNRAMQSIINSKSSNKYRLILDIIFDEDEELFHTIITNEILNLTNEHWLDSTKSNTENSIHIFYRYFAASFDEISKICTKDELKIFDDDSINTREKFETIRKIIKRNYDLSEFIESSSTITHGSSSYFTMKFERPQAIGLEILHSKRTNFVDIIIATDNWSRAKATKDILELPLITNANGQYKKEHLAYIRSPRPMYAIDPTKGNEFYKKLKETKEDRDSFLDEFDF